MTQIYLKEEAGDNRQFERAPPTIVHTQFIENAYFKLLQMNYAFWVEF